MSAAESALRLAAIQICSYRGFPHPITVWLGRHNNAEKALGKGKNLLLFGENGSGKSSFGKAIRDFLDLRTTAVAFDEFRYRHINPPRTDRGVSLLFDDCAVDPLSWNPTSRDAAHREFADMARSCGWLDYRVVWRISEIRRGDSVDIFKPLVEEILPACPRGTSSETFGDAWTRVVTAAAKKPIKSGKGWGLLATLLADLQLFNDSLEAFLPNLQDKVNSLITQFVPWTSIQITWLRGAAYDSRSRGNKFSTGSIQLRMIDRGGAPLARPSEFLNEARLTAIGLCLYLAGMSQSIPPKRADGTTYPRLLVLDDVLLSLDMAHRLPLLKLLKSADFTDWQLLLLTHDRAWYEIAKQQLEGWAHCELFAQRVGDYDQPMVREDQDHLSQAIDYLTAGDMKAAAVYVRTKFELVLKWACNELGLAVKYHPDPRKMPVSDFWAALNGATFDKIPSVRRARDSAGRVHWWQPKPDKTRVVPLPLADRIEHALKWVLNPLSHSQSVDRYRSEIEDAIFAVNDLEWEVRKSSCLSTGGTSHAARDARIVAGDQSEVNMSESRTAEQPTLFDAAAEKLLPVADECGAAVAESVLRRIAQFPRREELLELFGGGSLDSAPGQILWQGLGDAAAQVFVVYKLIHEALSNAPQFFRRSIEQFMRAQPERFGAVFTRETLWSLLAVSPKLEVPRELLNRDRIICLLHELNSRGIWRRNDGEIRREADYILSVLESNRQITKGFDALRRLQLEKANAIVRGNVLLFVPARLAQYATEVCALGEKGLLPSEEELLAKVAEFGRDPPGEGRHISIPLDVLFTEFADNKLHCFIFARTSASLSERRDLRAKSLFIRYFLGEAFRAYPPKDTSVRIAFYLDDDKSFRSQSAKERLFHNDELCDLSDFWSAVTGSPTGFKLVERIRDRAAAILKRDGIVDQIRKHFARQRIASKP